MAEIVQSLFGVTPDMYRQQQSAEADRRALAMAQLTPFQRAEFNIARGAYGLGGALAGALGAEDPQLKLISTRQAVAQQVNFSDPSSIQAGIQQLQQAGDAQGAMMLAQEYRKVLESGALVQQRTREGQAKSPLEELIRSGKYTPASIRDYASTGDPASLVLVAEPAKERSFGPEREAVAMELYGKPFAQLTQAEIAAVNKRVVPAEKSQTFGVEREAVARELYGKPFAELTTAQIAAVNKRVEAAKPSTTITNVLPGQKALVDIPEFRAKVQKTVEPQSKAVLAADNALTAIEDSIKTNNFISFNAARTQLAKALGDSQLSRRDVEQAGGDPSLLGRLADVTSTLFTGTPTVDTQNKIRQTLQAIRKVASDKARTEIARQRTIALRSPGYAAEAVDAALDFPEFAPLPSGGASGAAPGTRENPIKLK